MIRLECFSTRIGSDYVLKFFGVPVFKFARYIDNYQKGGWISLQDFKTRDDEAIFKANLAKAMTEAVRDTDIIT
jgi:hypothetical protein